MKRAEVEQIINEKYGENAKYIIKAIEDQLDYIDWKEANDTDEVGLFGSTKDERMANAVEHVLIHADNVNENKLTPVTAKVGDGATVHYYSDSHAGTIIKVTKKTITIQRDKAILDPNWKPEWISGGFAGHCTNQDEQTYTYERDENGQIYTFHWSDKYNSYGQPGDLRATKGRHEYYDYNF